MVNMAGGVMENAGLCLDRFGLPFIAGSAVKGCARRMAIQRLVEAETPEGEDKSAKKADLLFQIALIFGWTDTEWKDGRKPKKDGSPGELYSDFEYACGEGDGWRGIREPVARSLLDRLNVRDRKYPKEPWLDLPNYAASVSFLPAYPIDAAGADLPMPPPLLGTLQLDVVTCHHPDYYAQRKDRNGNLMMPVALDIEDPNPVIFPAVAGGHIFAFAVRPLRDCSHDSVQRACEWLAGGLATFGLGAKTAAGYGWFNTSPSIGQVVEGHLQARAEARRKESKAQEEIVRQRQPEEIRRQARETLEKATASMTEEETVMYTLKQLQEPQFVSKLDRWRDLSPGERLGIYHLMRSDKTAFWLDLRKKATEGKQKEKARWGHLVQDLFRMAKERKEKMPS
jgi:CRISPR/Cas system CMR subunit Cmr6 (Cas7 group RAMP superfamily)